MASLVHLTSTLIMSLCSFSVLVSGATINLVNRCSYVVWPAIYSVSGNPLGSVTPFGISPDNNNSVELPSVWNGRIWGRTGCRFNVSDDFVCDNGNCGGTNNSIECTRDGTTLPVTLAEISVGLSNDNYMSYYDISTVGGFNLPLTISPSPKNSSSLTCGSPTCTADALPQCPSELLRVSSQGTPLACSSPCNVFHTDQYCCTGNYSSQSACAADNYTQVFQNLCPTAFTSPFNGTTFACPVSDFMITFCSDGNHLQSTSPPPITVTSPPPVSVTSPLPVSVTSPPPVTGQSKHSNLNQLLIAGICTGIVVVVGVMFVCLILIRRIRRQKSEAEPIILGIGPQRFEYKELHSATKGFHPSKLLGQGAQGQVYEGVLGKGRLQVAIKRVAADKAEKGMRDLLSELYIISELKHRNLVQLQGWCKHRGELLVVYDYMPNGSLDKLLFSASHSKLPIEWHVRYRIICGLSTALLYLHEEGEKRVVHRDVKPSNIMLDANFEAKLGDFGLARVVDHNVTPRSTTAAGTIGYLAPEIAATRLPTAESDVYSFGIVALEVACGRPSFHIASESSIFLLDKVRDLSKQGRGMEAVDPCLAGGFDLDEMERLLFVGLAATDSDPEKRPTMRQVVAILTKQAPATLEEV